METQFLDLVEGLHRWCVAGQDAILPGLLSQAQVWLAPQLQPTPASNTDWLALWRSPLQDWWPMPLPAAWEASWRLLSRREATLTAEALTYLDAHRPGATAVGRPAAPHVAPLSSGASTPPEATPAGLPRWSLDDLVMCVTREVRRREQAYPHLVQQQRLTSAQAEQELSQMRAVLAYLLTRLREGTLPQQQVLF